MSLQAELFAALEQASEEARDIYIGTEVPHEAGPPNPAQFYRRFVAMNRPIVFDSPVKHWAALRKWSHEYLRRTVGEDTRVHVALTPNGLADAVTRHPSTGEHVFAKPHEAMMRFGDFVSALERPTPDRLVYYASHQNGSLKEEFSTLWSDIDHSLPWADEAFGAPPEAVNFWMGEDAARTTAHADLYENLYVVVRGSKTFTLLPPHDNHRLDMRPFRDATWRPPSHGAAAADTDDGGGGAPGVLELAMDEPTTTTRWIAMDLEDERVWPAGLRPLRVTLRAGQCLYIPSHWFHAVSQRGDPQASDGTTSTIAVNYWYSGEPEASLGPGFVQRSLLERLGDALAAATAAATEQAQPAASEPAASSAPSDATAATATATSSSSPPPPSPPSPSADCTIETLTSIKALPSHIQSGDLLLLDLDETLISPEPQDASEPWFVRFCGRLVDAGVAEAFAFAAGVELWQALQGVCAVEPVEPGVTPSAVRAAAAIEGVEVVGLTARGPEVAEVTIKQLSACGVYDGLFRSDLSLGELSWAEIDGRRDSRGMLTTPITHAGGIIFCSGSRKPAGLLAFEARLVACEGRKVAAGREGASAAETNSTRRVVLVDDRLSHVQALHEMLGARGRSFLGLHYARPSGGGPASMRKDEPGIARGWQLLARVLGSTAARKNLHRMLSILDEMDGEPPAPRTTASHPAAASSNAMRTTARTGLYSLLAAVAVGTAGWALALRPRRLTC
jgi:jumonji domain-containing protein 7